jgi:hypothetical protein
LNNPCHDRLDDRQGAMPAIRCSSRAKRLTTEKGAVRGRVVASGPVSTLLTRYDQYVVASISDSFWIFLAIDPG